MPELPEVEITVRRLAVALEGAEVESALAPGVVTLKSVEPPLQALEGRQVSGLRRRGKLVIVEFGELGLLVHLMSAGRLSVFDKRASLRDKASRLLIRLTDGRELRLREFGTRQRAWAKVLPASEVDADEYLQGLGPEALPVPDPATFTTLVDQPHHLHPLLRDQRTITGIGRTWVDDILWEARLSPFRLGSDLGDEEVGRLRVAVGAVLERTLDAYEQQIGPAPPDKMPKPVAVHGRAGEPCPRCGNELAAVHYKDYSMAYCPEEQTEGRVLKDRRLSRLLK
ncbi:MAG: DNA-formamidopyrimidine glycosylase family protein [Solirubrobacterales bacterium]